MKNNHIATVWVTIATVLISLMVSGCTNNGKDETRVNWITSTLESMPTETKIGHLFCLTVDPIHYFTNPGYKEDINSLIRKYRPGSINFSTNLEKWKPETLSEFNGEKLFAEVNKLHELQDIPMLIGAEFEDGAWFWDKKATRFPFQMALGTTRSSGMAYHQGQITASEAKAQGIRIIFAPVLNTVGYFDDAFKFRSYGDNIEAISELGLNFVKGCQEIGVAPCIKYFPWVNAESAGDTSPDADSLTPFKRCIDAGVDCVMIAPLILPSGNNAVSPEILKNTISTVLKNNFGFKGPVISMISDDTGASISDERLKQLAMDCLDAGCDILILPETTATNIPFIDCLLLDAENGKIDTKRIDDSVTRILTLKNKLNLHLKPTASPIQQVSIIGLKEYHNVADAISDSSITLLKNDGGILPFDYDKQYIVSVCFADENSVIEAAYYHKYLNEKYKKVYNISVIGVPMERVEAEIMRRVAEADVVLCEFFIKPSYIGDRFSTEARNLVRKILTINKRTAAISFYNPYIINQFPDFKGFIITYYPTERVMDKAIETVFGTYNPQGTLPAAISGRFPGGSGLHYPGP